jgi:hypothetical protein
VALFNVREHDTVTPSEANIAARRRVLGVMWFIVPSSSLFPQRPQLLNDVKYSNTSSCVGRFVISPPAGLVLHQFA